MVVNNFENNRTQRSVHARFPTKQNTPNATVYAALILRQDHPPPLVMLNRILDEERLRLPLNPGLDRRPDQIVEQERAVYQERESENLQPLECLPAQAKRHHPDEQRAAGVDSRARSCRDGARDRETKEVEATAMC
jgi:hypothetical protein